ERRPHARAPALLPARAAGCPSRAIRAVGWARCGTVESRGCRAHPRGAGRGWRARFRRRDRTRDTLRSQSLEPDVSELHLHRRPDVHLETQEAAARAVLRVIVDDAARDGAAP